MRVPDEARVPAADAPVEAHAELIVEVRTGSDAAERREVRRQQRRGNDARLVIALPASEKEKAVSTDRAAEGESELTPLKEWIGIAGVALERGIPGELVVAKEIKGSPVEIIGSGSCNDIDRARRGNTGRQIEVHGRDLELLYDFPRKAHLRATRACRHDAASIDGHSCGSPLLRRS